MKALKAKKYNENLSIEEIDCDELTENARKAIKEAIADAIQGKGKPLEELLRKFKR